MLGIFLVVLLIGGTQAAVSCLDQQGNPVDWYIIQKLPDISDRCVTCPHVKDGLAFLYMDANKHDQWAFSSESLNSNHQPLAYTLNQMYSRKDSEIEKYAYPDSGTTYGQSIICLTLNTNAQLDNVAHQLKYIMPNKYDFVRTLQFNSKYLDDLEAGSSVYSEPYTRQTVITTVGGQEFKHFAKCRKWTLDLYADLVKPGLNSSFYVETWLNGNAGDLPSRCDFTDYELHNLREVRPAGIDYMSSKDHSKWAVSYTSGKPWVCIGDINRQTSQDDRAGGTMCLRNAKVNAVFLSGTSASEACDGSLVATQGNPPFCQAA